VELISSERRHQVAPGRSADRQKNERRKTSSNDISDKRLHNDATRDAEDPPSLCVAVTTDNRCHDDRPVAIGDQPVAMAMMTAGNRMALFILCSLPAFSSVV